MLSPTIISGDVSSCKAIAITASEKMDNINPSSYIINDLIHHYDIEKAYTSMKLLKDFPGDNIERSLETEVVEAATE